MVDINTGTQKYIRSSSGSGLGHIAVHPSQQYFAVAEKGVLPNVLIFEYPSLKLYRMLRKGTLEAYSNITFNPKGDLLASVGSYPDFQLTVWDWKNESTILRTKVISFYLKFVPLLMLLLFRHFLRTSGVSLSLHFLTASSHRAALATFASGRWPTHSRA